MPDFLLLKFIKEIDDQISLLDINDSNLEISVKTLLNLRNNVLSKFFKNNSNLNWSVDNKKTLQILNKIQYREIWVNQTNNL